MPALSGCLSVFLRFCAGFITGAGAATVLWQIINPPFGPNYGEGIGYGFTMMGWMFIGGVVCGLLAISRPATAFSKRLVEGDEPNSTLNFVCFVLPLLLGLLPAFLIHDGEGLLGLIVCLVWALLILGAFFLRPKTKIKRAAWSYLLGFAVAVAFFFVGAYVNLSGQSSPWLQ